ncbi:hypothetical protein GLOTRDRAFT_134529 [Gloeophyllum trabeum ATCC 11539]|uniref:Uncharacterized protein n=1 Tax=Gloeophyllum trabeum (strain ATCC 11539 / FP-39264 / Madison 617) TaxID=670483 RepID=S7PQV9_GLOTA|nr:uncharacterized protein GLOTRDRAFT_134529 [Gloeophyllum trabeum ATCC 11539]EPQ49858.1 hypothetical protein GLOTRDRAFT_134529 [Gloeophyllum trabeum ATCC 11539]
MHSIGPLPPSLLQSTYDTVERTSAQLTHILLHRGLLILLCYFLPVDYQNPPPNQETTPVTSHSTSCHPTPDPIIHPTGSRENPIDVNGPALPTNMTGRYGNICWGIIHLPVLNKLFGTMLSKKPPKSKTTMMALLWTWTVR